MNYIIHTPSAAKLKKEILARVFEKIMPMARVLPLGSVLKQTLTSVYWHTQPTNGRRKDA